MKDTKVYLDNNATTGLDPLVLEAMLPHLTTEPANPSSIHSYGQQARQSLLKAREEIASYFTFRPIDISFTSGGTEALNLIIRGLLAPHSSGHIITSNIEHAAVYHTLQSLSHFQMTYLPAGLWGAVTPDAVLSAIRPDTRLIILSGANSETGVLIDIPAIASIAEAHQIPFALDAVALLGKAPFPIPRGLSAIAISAHKIHGPKGVGCALSRLPLTPILTGGPQEYNRRAGTENLPAIVGLAKALSLLPPPDPTLRDQFESSLLALFPPLLINGKGPRTCNTSNLSFPGHSGEELLIALDLAGIAVSHGSACSSGALEPSRILTQMGVAHPTSSLRFSLSRWTTPSDLSYTLNTLLKLLYRE